VNILELGKILQKITAEENHASVFKTSRYVLFHTFHCVLFINVIYIRLKKILLYIIQAVAIGIRKSNTEEKEKLIYHYF